MKILLFSPQAWGNIHISKHHYAIALANLGHEVYFVNPPIRSKKIIRLKEVVSNITVIESGFQNSLILRYKARFLYEMLVRKWVRKILKKVPEIDIAWCFETNIIGDLGVLKMKKIFHVVDPIAKRMIKTANKADLVICVSDRILNQFRDVCVRKIFINHALSDSAIKNAGQLALSAFQSNKRIRVGYVGNLTRKIIDASIIKNIIERFPQIEFNFWGPGNIESILGGESSQLIESIRHLPNVIFHPSVPSSDLIREIAIMDLFLLAYSPVDNLHDSSNSHKLLEYWATGKMVVSTYIDQYKGERFGDLLQMSPEFRNELMPDIFANVVMNLDMWNKEEIMNKRRSFALSQSYSKNVTDILELLDKS